MSSSSLPSCDDEFRGHESDGLHWAGRSGSDASSSGSWRSSVKSWVWGEKQTYLDQPLGLLTIPAKGTGMFEGFVGGTRRLLSAEHAVYERQGYIVINDQRMLERGMGAIFGQDGSHAFDIWYSSEDCLSFAITEHVTRRTLLVVGESPAASKSFKTSKPKAQVIRNFDLASNVPNGSVILHVDSRDRDSRDTMIRSTDGTPILACRGSIHKTLGVYGRYSDFPIALAGVSLIGGFLSGNNRYGLELHHCSKEEAALALACVHACAVRDAGLNSVPGILRQPKSVCESSSEDFRARRSGFGSRKEGPGFRKESFTLRRSGLGRRRQGTN